MAGRAGSVDEPEREWRYGMEVWQSSGPRPLTEALKFEVMDRFRLDESQAGKLCFIDKNGKFAGRSAKLVRIYDRDLLHGEESGITKHDHMDDECQAIVFEGHTEGSGQISLMDKRPVA